MQNKQCKRASELELVARKCRAVRYDCIYMHPYRYQSACIGACVHLSLSLRVSPFNCHTPTAQLHVARIESESGLRLGSSTVQPAYNLAGSEIYLKSMLLVAFFSLLCATKKSFGFFFFFNCCCTSSSGSNGGSKWWQLLQRCMELCVAY